MHHVRGTAVLLGSLMLFTACAADVADQTADDSDRVALVSEALSVATVSAVSFAKLRADFPAEVESQVDAESLRASTVVGWYDKGHNFHKEKMEKNLKSDFGDIVTNPAVLRGEVIQEVEAIQQEFVQ